MLDRDKLVALMATGGPFSRLSDAERSTIARQMREQQFGAGQVMFSRGDTSRDVFLVVEGRVRLSVVSAEGRELSFRLAEPGFVLGEIAAIDGGGRTAFATAVTPVVTATLGHVEFGRLLTSMPGLAAAFLELLCARLREADRQLEGVALHRIEVRLARFLLGLAYQKDPKSRGGDVVLDIGMSQSELAMLLGATRPKVNAALAALEEQGAVERRDTLLVCDIDELVAIASVD